VNLTKRERIIGIAFLAVLVLLVANNWIVSPLYAKYQDALKLALSGEQEVIRTNRLIKRRQSMQAEWRRRKEMGLSKPPSLSEAAMLGFLENWSAKAGLTVMSVRPERQPAEDGLQIIECRAAMTGSMSNFASLCWQLEHANIPLRLENVQLSSSDATRDSLNIQLDISTLCLVNDEESDTER